MKFKTVLSIIIGILVLAGLAWLIFFYGSRTENQEQTLSPEESFIKSTTAPLNASLFTPEQTQEFRDRTSASGGAIFSEVEIDEFVQRTTAP